MNKRIIFCLVILLLTCFLHLKSEERNPVVLQEFVNRVGGDGAANRFTLIVDETLSTNGKDIFIITTDGAKPCIKGNSTLSVTTGFNWYLNHFAHINLAWNNGVKADLTAATLPLPMSEEQHISTADYRYYFNYCTFSYSMAFWTWERWQKEIDWMALHGINLPLSLVGMDVVWKNVLTELGYNKKEINDFIAGPGFQAWWLMNNLEGWGGANPDWWYERQEVLAKNILNRMRSLGMQPVLAGYSGMVPNNIKAKKGWNVADPGAWCTFRRPAFLVPTDSHFSEMATLYYKHLRALMGTSRYYSMDPFHEGGNTSGVNLPAAYRAIQQEMDRENPNAVWVIQSWNENPRLECLQTIKSGKLLVLDLFSDGQPKWQNGYNGHDFVYCMLHNFGGRVGLHGRLETTMNGYYKALRTKPNQLKGIGATPEGIETNPMLYDALFELPWANNTSAKNWLNGYVKARYSAENTQAEEAWNLLLRSVYDCKTSQQGTSEPVICARPNLTVNSVSTWSTSAIYYDKQDVIKAASLLLEAGATLSGDNYNYDLVDVVRQAITDRASGLLKQIKQAYDARDIEKFTVLKNQFLQLILDQDRLLATHSGFSLGTWTGMARNVTEENPHTTIEDKKWMEWNARTQITVWGTKSAANNGGLHDYSNREWSGLLKDFHYKRWNIFFDNLLAKRAQPDWFSIEEAWTKDFTKQYHNNNIQESTYDVARELFEKYFSSFTTATGDEYYWAYGEETDVANVNLFAYRGEKFTCPVKKKKDVTAKFYIDFNGNGTFDENEEFDNLTVTVPETAVTASLKSKIVLSDGTKLTFLLGVADRITTPRTVKVLSSNAKYGKVQIINHTELSITTTDYVEVSATATNGYDFVSWTDDNGNVISQSARFIYYGKNEVTLTANFMLNKWGVPHQDKSEWNVINDYQQYVKELSMSQVGKTKKVIYSASETPKDLFVTLPQIINVARGSYLKLHWKDPNNSGLSYCRLSAYIDLNNDGDFQDKNELIALKGNRNMQNLTLGNDSIAFFLSPNMPIGLTHIRLRFDGAWTQGWDSKTDAKPAKASTQRMIYEVLVNVTEFPAYATTIEVKSNDIKEGTVTISGLGNKATVQPGERITLQAQPQTGYRFQKWVDIHGRVVSNEANYSFIPVENGLFTALFYSETGVETQNISDVEIKILDGKIIVESQESYKVYELSGVPIPPQTPLNTGVYLVEVGHKIYKVLVK